MTGGVETSIQVVLSRVGGHLFAIDAARVVRISDQLGDDARDSLPASPTDTSGGAMQRLDLADLLPDSPRDTDIRRLLRVSSGDDVVELLVGTDVHVEFLDPSALYAVPAFLERLGKRVGLMALIDTGDGFAWVVDPDGIRAGLEALL